ncbi:MAG: hypothetical protein ACRDRV_13795, partial [Pseudonocardiaceae bacterium]
VEVIPGGGTVAISAVADGDDCLITVTADGPQTPADSEPGDLSDLDGRLRSAFGAGYGLVTRCALGGGSTVTLRVPQVRTEPQP